MTRRAQWYPTSDQKRVRYGAPGVQLLGESSKEGFSHLPGRTWGTLRSAPHRCFRQLKPSGASFSYAL
jgi:hypothetical protein